MLLRLLRGQQHISTDKSEALYCITSYKLIISTFFLCLSAIGIAAVIHSWVGWSPFFPFLPSCNYLGEPENMRGAFKCSLAHWQSIGSNTVQKKSRLFFWIWSNLSTFSLPCTGLESDDELGSLLLRLSDLARVIFWGLPVRSSCLRSLTTSRAPSATVAMSLSINRRLERRGELGASDSDTTCTNKWLLPDN